MQNHAGHCNYFDISLREMEIHWIVLCISVTLYDLYFIRHTLAVVG